MKAALGLSALAAAFWFVLFSPVTAGWVNFWVGMALAAGCLATLALFIDRKNLREIYAFRPSHLALGVGAAAFLYAVFWVGDAVSAFLFDFARPQVGDIYARKTGLPTWAIGVLLLLWIGPAEEVFWRGFVQRRLAGRWGAVPGFVVASLIYAGVHVVALNFMLFMAALICGLFWGAVYLKTRSVWPGIVSHALWDVAVFVLFPIQPH
jgi:hypothetical protein